MKTFSGLILIFVWFLPSAAHTDESPVGDSMGVAVHFVEDTTRAHWTENRARPILLHSFYPTTESFSPLHFGPNQQAFFLTGHGQRNAPLTALKPQHHPVIILSHGTGSGGEQMGWIAQALVKQGYIAIAINHHGNTYVEPYLAQGFTHYWERAQDVRFTIDWVLQQSPLKEYIDPKRIAVVGFSLGGYTALATAGAITDRHYFLQDFCQSPLRDATCEPLVEFPDLHQAYAAVSNDPKVKASLKTEKQSFLDPRIKAVVAISPPGRLLNPESLNKLTQPTLLLVGAHDEITPAKTNAHFLAQHIPQAKYHEIAGASHYSMISLCTPAGIEAMPHLCVESHSRDRKLIHRDVTHYISDFLTRAL